MREPLFLRKLAIKRALRRPSPNSIPLSGYDRLRRRNYFTVNLGDGADRWRFLVRAEERGGISGLWFPDAQNEATEASVPFSSLREYELAITYYCREIELRFSSGLEFIIHVGLGLPYLRLLRERAARLMFNRKQLVRGDRIDVLQKMFEGTFTNHNYRASAGVIMTALYGPRWGGHPEHQRLYNYYDLLLRSLVSSGDLREDQHSFALDPRGLQTLSDREEDDRRHRDQIRQQRILGFLTFALVVIGAVQAWTGWESIAK